MTTATAATVPALTYEQFDAAHMALCTASVGLEMQARTLPEGILSVAMADINRAIDELQSQYPDYTGRMEEELLGSHSIPVAVAPEPKPEFLSDGSRWA